MGIAIERDVALEIEKQLAALRVDSPCLAQLPIAPLRGVADLVRLELALPRFAATRNSKRDKVLISGVRMLLGEARAKLRAERSANVEGSTPTQIRDSKPQPAA
jgi:hypothetical protein